MLTSRGQRAGYDVTLTYDDDQVSKESGSVGSDAATYGTNYVATFEAESGYELQSDVTVTIGESTASKGTEYTWAISDGVGTLTILGSYITDDIEVTVEADVLCTDVDAPTSLTCSAQTPTTLTYTWTKASNASGYTASLWDNSSCTGDAVSTQNLGDVATVTFTSLSASTTYYCKV